MSLPARQLHKLEEIEGGLTGSDPRLRSLFAIFTRLTRGEAMPWFEEVPVRPIRDALAAAPCRYPAGRPQARRPGPGTAADPRRAERPGLRDHDRRRGSPGAPRPSVSAKPPAARELILKSTRMCRLGMIRFPALAC